ncbi:MAG: hypothetical protein AB1627_14270 [Chloroflexota bacterium]
MSAAGGVLNRIVGSLGGAQTAAVLVIGGIVVGGATGGALASGALSGNPATTGDELSVYPCPDVGPALFTVPGGQKFLATGKTADGSWLRIHNPLPGRTEAWVPADPLTVNGSMADLPVAECAPELAILASPMPAPTLTAIQDNSPSPAPTPVPTPTPTATPVANVRPSLSALTVSTRKISYDTGAYCPNAVKKVTFKVKATDSVGVEAVTLFWRKPGASGFAQSPMSRTAGTAKSGTWQLALNTAANDITSAGRLAYYAVATDADGATRRLPTEGSNGVTVAVCVNTGPTIKSASSTAGSHLSWKPLRTGTCQYPTATTIRANVSDVDGVDTVTLFFRPPGEGWRSKPMTLSSGRWTASLDTGSDKIIITDPPTDLLRWYVKATDKTGLASQTKAASITIHRCDTEAQFGQSSANPAFCPGRATNFFSGSVIDQDGLTGSSATLVYTYVAKDGSRVTRSVRMSGSQDGQPWYYHVAVIGPSDLQTSSVAALFTTFEIRTIDQYGGRSTGAAGRVLQSCQ